MKGGTIKPVRCAIYTRVSTDHGLEQDFNSLDAQHDAAQSYIRSQAHASWTLIRSRYDDGGYSGGSTERPALQRLLADVRSRKVDVIVVYKVDRLTRSLADFAKLVELFDGHGVSFVSVTQQFNTTTSMGRLTLNVLLSFAQFEREVTSERSLVSYPSGAMPPTQRPLNMRKENTMVYFKALLLLERPRPLRLHDFGTRRQPGHELCSRQHEFVDAEEFAPVRGHLAVELLDMDIQKALAKFRSVRWRSAIAAASSESRAVLAGSLARSLWLRSQKRVEAALSKPKSLRSSGRATHHAVASSEEKPVFSSMALSLAAPSTALSIDVIGNDPQARGLSARIAAEMIACKDAGVEAP